MVQLAKISLVGKLDGVKVRVLGRLFILLPGLSFQKPNEQ